MSREDITLARHVPELALDWLRDTPAERCRVLEGTLCFADISGFTALAERLAQRGRMGGEELVETLGSVFTTMIGLARERGGILLKFGGDALLLFFRGEDHPVQAASAAVEMRTALRAAAKMPSSVGPLRLSMSVGLHSGPVHFFLVGANHRELVLLGPATNRIVEVEGAADRGEIVVSEETAARLPAEAISRRADGARLLRWRTPRRPPIGSVPRDHSDHQLASQLFPAELGTFLSPGASDAEHRVACIAFIRFSGTDRILKNEGSEALAEALEATIGRCQQILDEEGVTLLAVDLDRDGGKLFLASGIPFAHEDDEGVMLRALRRIADAPLPLDLQFGVNRGHVFAAEVGDERRAAFSAMGDTTNTAARIAAKAPVGQIFAHPAVLDNSLTIFRVESAGPLTMKGKSAPLAVYQVGQEIGTRTWEGLELEVLVGREHELEVLRSAISSVSSGNGGVLTLVGDSGLGKTRLLREATGGIGHCLFIRGEPYGASSPYRALRDPLRSLLGIERGDHAHMRARLMESIGAAAPTLLPLAALVGDVIDVPVSPSEEVRAIEARFRPDRTADTVVALLSALIPQGLTWVVDDAHWCDDATAGLLRRVEHECQERAWLMLVSRRNANSGFQPEVGKTLPIAPMPDADIRRLTYLLTEAAPLLPHELDEVAQRAGGYPLVVEEIVRTLRDVGSLDAVPETLEAALSTQVDRLDRVARKVLQYASVLGRSFSTGTLTDLLALDGHQRGVDILQRLSEFLVAEDAHRLQFRSGMLRDVVYEGMAFRLRARLHEQAAEALLAAADDPASIADWLAIHFARASNHTQAWKYGRLAGDRARDRHAMSDAIRLYELALDAAKQLDELDPTEHLRAWCALGLARLSTGVLEGALEAYRRALRLAGPSPLDRADVLLNLAKTRERAGRPATALRDLTQAMRALQGVDSPPAATLAAAIQSYRANVLFHADRLREAHDEAARAIPTAQHANATGALAMSLSVRDMARTMLDGPGDVSGLEQALSLFEQINDMVPQGTVLTNLGAIAWIKGDWQQAKARLYAARERYLRGGNAPEAALAAYNLAEMLLCQGQIEEAGSLLADALPVLKAARWREGVCDIQRQLGHVLIERGEFAAADRLLGETIEEYARLERPGPELDAMLVRAAGRISSGDLQVGEALLDDIAARTAGDSGMLAPKIALLRAIALARQGRFDEAAEQCRIGRAAAEDFDLNYENALISRLWLSLPNVKSMSGEERASLHDSVRLLQDLGVERVPRSFTLSQPPRTTAA